MRIDKKCSCGNSYKGKGTKCRQCRYQLEKSKDPQWFAYRTLRSNAKRRNKFFDLTFDEFKEFCIEYDYMDNRGITATSFHIDRIKEHLGYTKANIRAIENADNVRKYIKWCNRNEDGINEFETITTGIMDTDEAFDDLPF